MWNRIQLITLMRIRIQLITLMRIRILLSVLYASMRIQIHNTGTDTDGLPVEFNDRLAFICG
jgi:hypothetical protein